MKNNIIILLLSILSGNVFGQNINFDIVVLDTSEHFNPSRYASTLFDSDIVINNDSVFKEVFRRSPFTIGRPKFTEVIWLKRTIRGSCLTKINNAVIVDSIKRTVTWNTTVESANCKSKDIRHIVLQIPTPPNGFEVLFDTIILKSGSNDTIINKQGISSFQYNTPTSSLSPFLSSLGIVINNDSLFTHWKKKGMLHEKPDFEKEMILAGSYRGDCHMRLMPHTFFDSLTNTLVLNVYNIYGGCRAGGGKSIAIKVEKPKGDFSVVFS